MGRFSSVLLVGVTGCAQLAGLDETTGLIPPDQVSLSFERVSTGATVERAAQDLTGYNATYLIVDANAPDGLTKVFAQQSAFDTWTAEIPEGTPAVTFSLPDAPRPIPRLWAFPNRNLKGAFDVMEHPHPTPAPAGAMLTVQAILDTAYAANETLTLYNIGTWTFRVFPAAELPGVGALQLGPATFAYESMTSVTGRPHEKITTADAPLVLRHVGSDLTGFVSVTPFDQSGADMLTGTMMPNPHDLTLDVQLSPAAVPARFAPARPAVANVAMSWSLSAAPGHELGNNSGPTLRGAPVLMTDTGILAVPYGNPFEARGWKTTLAWAASASRVFTPAGQTLSATLVATIVQLVYPTTGMSLDLPASLPEAITIDGKPLSTDGVMITKPTRAVSISFIVAKPCTLAQMQLFDLVPNMAGTALEYRYILEQSGPGTQFFVPPELLEVGHNYTLRSLCVVGSFPTIGDGDLSHRDLPLAYAYFDSGVFTVVAP